MPIQPHFSRFMSIKLFLAASFIFVFSLLSGCASDTQQSMPNFKVSEISGKTLTQADLAGKVTVINFWATSCVTCVKEIPDLVNTYDTGSEEEILNIFNKLSFVIEGGDVETIEKNGKPIACYINMGEPYEHSIFYYFENKKFIITSYKEAKKL